jgi:hypothetical protein
LGVYFGPPIWVPIGGFCFFSYVCVQTGGVHFGPQFLARKSSKTATFWLQKCRIKTDFMMLFLWFCKRCPPRPIVLNIRTRIFTFEYSGAFLHQASVFLFAICRYAFEHSSLHGTLASHSLAHLIAYPNPVSSAVLRKSSASISFLKLILRHCLDVSMSVSPTL